LDGQNLTGLAADRDFVYLVNKLSLEGRIGNNDGQVGGVDILLNNLGKSDDEMAFGWLVESECVIDRGHERADL
jgi:hypothetical protein